MVDFVKWCRRLDALVVHGYDRRTDTVDETRLFTLPASWRSAAVDILGCPVQDNSHFRTRPAHASGEIEARVTSHEPEREGRLEMKTDKASKKTSKGRDEDLDEMRNAFRAHKERAQGGGGGKNDWDKLGNGKNLRFILRRVGERKFYTEGWTHFGIGPNERAVRCVDEASIDPERTLPTSGTKCPLCKKFLREQSRINSEYAKGDKEGHAEWKRAKDKYTPRHQFYSNVLKEDDDDDFEVKIFAYGPQVWGQLMNYYLGDDTSIGDFTDPESGRWMNIKKESKGGSQRRNVEYKVFPASEPTDISDAWDSIKEALHDLEAAPGKILSADEVIAIMKGVDPDRGSDDDDARPSRSSSRRSSRDDDEDSEEDADDADDDDDRPVRSSKLASKLKKRRDD